MQEDLAVSKQMPPTSIRMPTELKRWLGHRAVDNDVSLNQEVLSILYREMARESKEKETKDANK